MEYAEYAERGARHSRPRNTAAEYAEAFWRCRQNRVMFSYDRLKQFGFRFDVY